MTRALIATGVLLGCAMGCGEAPSVAPQSAPAGVVFYPAQPILVRPPWEWIKPVQMLPTLPPAAAPSAAPSAAPKSTLLAWTDESLAGQRNPVVSVSLAAAGAPMADLPDRADAWQPTFRACFDAALRANPKMLGGVRLTVEVAPTGAVSELTSELGGWVSAELAECLANRVRRETFDPPDGGAAHITMQLNLWQGFSAPATPNDSQSVIKKAPKS